jgi:hypothetical protein
VLTFLHLLPGARLYLPFATLEKDEERDFEIVSDAIEDPNGRPLTRKSSVKSDSMHDAR